MATHTQPVLARWRTLFSVLSLAITAVYILISTIIPVEAATVVVNPGDSIQTAINNATAGDTILINAGTYTESILLNKPVSLTGVSSDTTILNGVAGQHVISVAAGISNNVVISGMTIQNGGKGLIFPDLLFGAGLYLNGSPRLSHLTIQENDGWTALEATAGVYIEHSLAQNNLESFAFVIGDLYMTHTKVLTHLFGGTFTLDGDTVIHSSQIKDATFGSGVAANRGSITIIDSEIENNGGGGIFLRSVHDIRVISSTIASNGRQGGIRGEGHIYLTSTHLLSNEATNLPGGGAYAGQSITATNSVISGNLVTTIGDGIEDPRSGGGLYAEENITLINIDLLHNTAVFDGGGAYATNMYIYSSTVGYNDVNVAGSGLHTDWGFVSNSVFTGNHSALFSGGMRALTATIDNSSFINNESEFFGSAIESNILTLTNSIIERNGFEDLPFNNLGSSPVWASAGLISNTQFLNNGGSFSGAIAHAEHSDVLFPEQPDLEIINSRFISNYGRMSTEAIRSNITGTLRVVNSLFARNPILTSDNLIYKGDGPMQIEHISVGSSIPAVEPAVLVTHTAEVTLLNSIIASYTTAVKTGDVATAHIDYTLFTSATPFSGTNIITGPNNITNTNPLFADISANDYRLLSSSPAINTGAASSISTDIDGNPRPGSASPVPDRGAYECDPAASPSNFTGDYSNGQITLMWQGLGSYQLWQLTSPYDMIMGGGIILDTPNYQHQANSDNFFYAITTLTSCGLASIEDADPIGYFNFNLEPGS